MVAASGKNKFIRAQKVMMQKIGFNSPAAFGTWLPFQSPRRITRHEF
jgi:hypothetical protein